MQPSLAGQWGGDHVSLTISDQGSHVELDCAHGDFPATLAAEPFNLTGTFVVEHGGPIRSDEKPDSHQAVFAGTVAGDRMTLTIRLSDTGETVGTFALTRGSAGRVMKCL
jgi:hypothetical protein